MEKRKKGLETTYKKYDSDMNGFYHMDMLPVSGAQTKSPTDNQLQTTPPSQLKQEKEEWETSLLSVRNHLCTIMWNQISHYRIILKMSDVIAQ